MSVIIRSQDLNELTLKQFGGPYDEPWTDEPTPPVEFCECGEVMSAARDFFGIDWEYVCINKKCELYGLTQSHGLVWDKTHV